MGEGEGRGRGSERVFCHDKLQVVGLVYDKSNARFSFMLY